MDSALAAAIRRELRAFVEGAGSRRALPTTCHVGHPGQEPGEDHSRLPDTLPHEFGLWADLVERAVDGLLETGGACAWVTRSGALDLTDADAAWFAAARTAFGRHGLELPAFFVLNRSGWVDLVSGDRQVWSRVRHRTPAGGRRDVVGRASCDDRAR